jgi:hypothetical protein
MKIAILTYRMAQGYGVDVVVAAHARYFELWGHNVRIFCIDADGSYPDLNIQDRVSDLERLKSTLASFGPDAVIAHTSPFFEWLAELNHPAAWGFDHGDPSPHLFLGSDVDTRKHTKDNKIKSVYRQLRGVIVPSQFLRHDIQWPQAHVVLHGSNHVSDEGPKSPQHFQPLRPLRVGTLARLGPGEALYKGTHNFVAMVERLRSRGLPIVGCFLGRGSAHDATFLSQRGFETHLNASELQRDLYLRGLDVFVSLSEWEGFNLPLVEAQALGTLSLSLNRGAHSEVCANVFESATALEAELEKLAVERSVLPRRSHEAYSFVRSRFDWHSSALKTLMIVSGGVGQSRGIEFLNRLRWTNRILRKTRAQLLIHQLNLAFKRCKFKIYS